MVVSEFSLTSSGKTVKVRPSKANGSLVYRIFFPNQTEPIAALRFDDANVCKDLWADRQVGLEALELAVRALFCVMAKAFFDRKLTPYFIPQEVRSRFPPKNPTAAWVNLDAMSKRFYKYTQDVEERKNAVEIRVQTSGGHLLDPMPSWLDKNNRADQWEFQLYEAVRLHDYELTPWKHTITPISHPSQLTGKDREENLISLEKTLTAPAPGFSEDEGESWRWGNYILTLQKNPRQFLKLWGKLRKPPFPKVLWTICLAWSIPMQ